MAFGRRPRLVPTTQSSIAYSRANLTVVTPSERQLENKLSSRIKSVLADLLNVYFPAEERMAGLQRARKLFYHESTSSHNEELMVHGVAGILYIKLAFAVMTRASDQEIRLICEVLEMVITNSDMHAIEDHFEDCGREALPLLTTVLQLPFRDTHGRNSYAIRVFSTHVDHERDKILQRNGCNASVELKMAAQHVCKILAKFSLVNDATHYMAIQPYLIPSLKLVVSACHGMTTIARYGALAVLANLAQLGESDTRIVLASHPGLLESVAKMALPHEDPVSRKAASSTLMHLTYGSEDHIPLLLSSNDFDSPHDDFSVLDVWIELLRDADDTVRRHAVLGLYNAACGDENTLPMVVHKGGAILEALILKATSEEEDAELRVFCLETIYNLSCSALSNVHNTIGTHPGLLMALASFLRFREQAPLPAKETAACVLHRMAQVATLDLMPECQQVLFSALVLGSSWKRTPDVARALDLQAFDNPEGMAKHLGLLDGLSSQALCIGEGENERNIRAAAVSAILRLAGVETNRKLLANHEGTMLALTRASFDNGPVGMIEYSQRNLEEQEAFIWQLNRVNITLKELVLEMNAQPKTEEDIDILETGTRKFLLLTSYPDGDPRNG